MAPKYPNQQLKSVTMELFFPGRLEALGCLGQIQRDVEHELTHLFVPNIQVGEAPALRPFQLRNEAGTRSLALAVNQISYIAFNEYPGFTAFREEGLPILLSALERLQVSKIARVRYLYENEVGLQDQDGFEVGSLFPGVLAVGAPTRVLPPFHSAAEWLLSRDQVGFDARIEGSSPVLKVAVSSAAKGPISLNQIRDAIDRTHQQANALFEALISPAFRNLISEEA